MATTERLSEETALPLVIRSSDGERDLERWVGERRTWIGHQLLSAGALLFRGFDVASPETFNRVVMAVSGSPLEYRERSSPRSAVMGNIYSSTDYPPEYPIFLHNESSYAASWALNLLFYCHVAPVEGGETPVADTSRILGRLDPVLKRPFLERGVMYVRNFHDGVGLSWSTVFQTEDRGIVEDYCRRGGIAFEWLPENGLRTRHVRPAVARHPRLGTDVWFNHATFFNVSTLDPDIRDMLLSTFREDGLPNNTYYGDGTPIEPTVLDELRGQYTSASVKFRWEQGDVLLVDNMLTAHGRSPYRGPRQILVAMTEQVSRESLLSHAG
jgi:alpha-ketoglutarate-dependent taurine dioxygenase